MLLTIGHSNRPLEEFLTLLDAHGVRTLVDVRAFPQSRHNPQFNRDSLPASLAGSRVEYVHMAGLGGHRKPKPDSVNTGWRNLSFRGYADYMQTPEFEKNLAALEVLAESRIVAIMCAESVPWRCHRSLIADALTVRGVEVRHIMGVDTATPHHITPFAVVELTHLSYPGDSLQLF